MRCFEQLGLPDSALPSEVRARWRELASEHHPDRGGDAEAFNDYRQAYEQALHEAQQPVPCGGCEGTGKKRVRRGFSEVRLPCTDCDGKGEVQREDI